MAIKGITTKEAFQKFIQKTKDETFGYKDPIGFGVARVDRGQGDSNKILQASFPIINWNENLNSAAIFIAALKECNVSIDFSKSEFVCDVKKGWVKNALMAYEPFLKEAEGDAHKNLQVLKHLNFISQNEGLERDFRLVFIFEDAAPLSVEVVYLKLYALSSGKAPLDSLNFNNAFNVLENVAWSLNVPIELAWLRENEIELKLDGTFPVIDSVDRFPRFLQHVIPSDETRILDGSKVCMGAQLSDRTTVTPSANYIDFNVGAPD